jgi:hypothetical protein
MEKYCNDTEDKTRLTNKTVYGNLSYIYNPCIIVAGNFRPPHKVSFNSTTKA